MSREIFLHLPVVIAVAKHGSFIGAAGALNMSASAVSHAVKAVEDRLGEPIFARTTRSVALTEAGIDFVTRVGGALDDIGTAFEDLTAKRGEVSGLLRLNASRVAFKMALVPILAKLAREQPKLTVEVHTDDALVDIVAQGFDAGIRLGEAVQQDMVAVRLTAPFRAILVASPEYVGCHGIPKSLSDLANHNCIGFRLLATGRRYDWDLCDGERRVAIPTRGTVVITDATFARDLALAGVGVAYIFEPQVRQDILEGRLQWLLPEASLPEGGLFLYFPRRASLSPKLRAFIDAAKSCAG